MYFTVRKMKLEKLDTTGNTGVGEEKKREEGCGDSADTVNQKLFSG